MVARWEGGGKGDKIKYKWLLQNSHGDVKRSTGNTVSKILILCVVSGGHEVY